MQPLFPRDFEVDVDDWAPLKARVEIETLGGYSRYRTTLTPRFDTVRRDIALGYAALVAIVVGVASVDGVVAGLIAATLGAVGIGIAIAYLQLFIHEAAHANLAASRRTSDRIADALIAWQVGTSIAAYRAVHFDHHRHLGHARDGERSYVTHALTTRLIVEMLTGIHAVRIFLTRAQIAAAQGGAIQAAADSRRSDPCRDSRHHVDLRRLACGAGLGRRDGDRLSASRDVASLA